MANKTVFEKGNITKISTTGSGTPTSNLTTLITSFVCKLTSAPVNSSKSKAPTSELSFMSRIKTPLMKGGEFVIDKGAKFVLDVTTFLQDKKIHAIVACILLVCVMVAITMRPKGVFRIKSQWLSTMPVFLSIVVLISAAYYYGRPYLSTPEKSEYQILSDVIIKFVHEIVTTLQDGMLMALPILIICLIFAIRMWPEGSFHIKSHERSSSILQSLLFGVSMSSALCCGCLLLNPSEEMLHHEIKCLVAGGLAVFFGLSGINFRSKDAIQIKSHPLLSDFLEMLSYFVTLICAAYSIREFANGFIFVMPYIMCLIALVLMNLCPLLAEKMKPGEHCHIKSHPLLSSILRALFNLVPPVCKLYLTFVGGKTIGSLLLSMLTKGL